MSDEQFHEFQLDGKQLVFLFMAGTVVAVVIFLCGVMVGRGVQSARGGTAEFSAAVAGPVTDPTLDPPSDVLAPIPPPPTADELAYTASLQQGTLPPETVREPVPPPAEPEPAPAPPQPERVEAPPAARAAAAPRGGLVLQVTALARESDAESLRRRLVSKKYPAYVEKTPDARFRVRVGPFRDRNELDRVRRRLETEEHFTNLWIPPS
jgi:cell division septation protein DedD